jgi:hypothetical protein
MLKRVATDPTKGKILITVFQHNLCLAVILGSGGDGEPERGW